MAATEADVFNLAVSAAGEKTSITNVDQQGRAAELCRLHYKNVRDRVLMAAPWSCAKKTKYLELLAEAGSGDWVEGDPEPGWQFVYKLPADYLYPRYTGRYGRFILGNRNGLNVVYSNDENALLTYTFVQADVAKWPETLVGAVSDALAAKISMPLSGKNDRVRLLLGQANNSIIEARVLAANEDTQMLETLPPWLAARGAFAPMFPDRFIYPVGPLLSV